MKEGPCIWEYFIAIIDSKTRGNNISHDFTII